MGWHRKTVLTFVVTFATLNMLALVVGQMRRLPPTLAGFITDCDDKPRPCWFGIVPGVTRLADARQILVSQGYDPNNLNWRYTALGGNCQIEIYPASQARLLGGMYLDGCHDIHLGEVLSLVDRPSGFFISSNHSLWLYTFQGRLAIIAPHGADMPRWSPHMRASKIWLFNASFKMQYLWRGFVPRWRACQLEAAYLWC
jgi:hypothetical protein